MLAYIGGRFRKNRICSLRGQNLSFLNHNFISKFYSNHNTLKLLNLVKRAQPEIKFQHKYPLKFPKGNKELFPLKCLKSFNSLETASARPMRAGLSFCSLSPTTYGYILFATLKRGQDKAELRKTDRLRLVTVFIANR